MPTDLHHEESYQIRAYDIDHQKRMTIPALVRMMQEAAMQHVILLKLSVWDLETEQLAWVLMRMQLEVKRIPLLNEQLTIRTRPTGLERILTYRNFWVYDAEGELIVEAVTHWVLMNTETRRLSAIPDWITERFKKLIPEQVEGLLPHRDKFPMMDQVDYRTDFRVRWHDLDFNLHLNNTFYILYLLEGLPTHWLTEKKLTALDIQFKLEVRKEERFGIEVRALPDQRFLHRMVQEGRILAEMVTQWS
jgi:acyl-ACP thioesterase